MALGSSQLPPGAKTGPQKGSKVTKSDQEVDLLFTFVPLVPFCG
jgi:hypothetical protein